MAVWAPCLSHSTAVVSVATSGVYFELAVHTATTAHAVGIACITVAASDDVTASHRLVRRLQLQFAASWRPSLTWCRRKLAGWRHASVLKTQAMLLLLSHGINTLFVDADWRFGRSNPLAALAACGHDAVALKDKGHFVNVGLLWIRSTPATVAMARRTANRSLVAWDQAVFNEEAGAAVGLTCCHANRFLGRLFHRDGDAHSLKHSASRSAMQACSNNAQTSAAALPPPARRAGESHLYRAMWDGFNFNELSDDARHRCPGCRRTCSLSSCRCTQNLTTTAERAARAPSSGGAALASLQKRAQTCRETAGCCARHPRICARK